MNFASAFGGGPFFDLIGKPCRACVWQNRLRQVRDAPFRSGLYRTRVSRVVLTPLATQTA